MVGSLGDGVACEGPGWLHQCAGRGIHVPVLLTAGAIHQSTTSLVFPLLPPHPSLLLSLYGKLAKIHISAFRDTLYLYESRSLDFVRCRVALL